MPQNTGVKNRINYFERLVKEDAKFAVNDEKYGEYLKSLGTLVGLTNQIYDVTQEPWSAVPGTNIIIRPLEQPL